MPSLDKLAGRRLGHVFAQQGHFAADNLAQAGQRLGQLGLAVALHARDAEDLAGAHLQRDAIDRHMMPVVGHAQVFDAEHRCAGCASDFSICRMTSRPTIISASSARVASAGFTEPTIWPPRITLI